MPNHTDIPRIARAASACLAACVAAVSAHAAPPSYLVEEIGTGLTGFDMNDAGTAVGRALNAQQVGRAFIAPRGGAFSLLPTPAEWQSSDAYAISPNGIVVGAVSTSTIASIGSRPAAWYPTRKGYGFVLLPTIPGDVHGAAFGVNSHGDIVGGSGGLGLGSYPRAALFAPTGATLLPNFGTPADVNEHRIAVASNELLDLATMQKTVIPLPAGNWQGVITSDISDTGNICGQILGFSGCSTFPLRYRPETGWEFVGGCATTTSAVSVNDRGDALAYVANTASWVSFVGEPNMSPSGLIAPSQGAWDVMGASVIADNRMVLAGARPAGSAVTRLVRLVPILPEELDGDGTVGAADLALLLGAWGGSGSAADIDGSGLVDAADLGMLLAAWTS
ncbi:MAG: hypothetical protein ACKOYN_10955 [Planctomycetota bacterium]